jgi:hypothetical protein
MAVPISFAIDSLRRAGWKPPEEMQTDSSLQAQNQAGNSNTTPMQP